MFRVCGGIGNDHAQDGALNPEPVGSGKDHQPTVLTTRLLVEIILFSFLFLLYRCTN
jgi:hypothetical protein